MKRRTLLALAASTMFLAACGQSTTNEADTSATDSAATGGSDLLQRINNGGTINVGTEGTYPPFTYHDESGKLTGYDVEVTRAVADKLGVDVEFKET
ncbi:transporter substrate-binding domain-containing protein, partial [Marinobacter sp. 1Y8]